MEIVVSDNCSTDGTCESVLELSSGTPHLRYFRNPTNCGPCANIKLAIERARGRYIWLFGDDDKLREGAVDEVVRVLEDNPSIGYIFVARELYNSNLSRRLERYPAGAVANQLFENGKRLYVAGGRRPLGEILGYISSTIFRKELWVRALEKVSVDWTSSFAHLYVILSFIRDHPCYYIATPYVLVRTGNTSHYCHPAASKTWFEDLQKVYTYARALGFDGRTTDGIKRRAFVSGARVLLADVARGWPRYRLKDLLRIVNLPPLQLPVAALLTLTAYYLLPRRVVRAGYRLYTWFEARD